MNRSERWNPGGAGWMLAPVAALALLLVDGVPAAAQGACPDWNVPARLAQAPNPVPAGEAAVTGGREIFQRQCASCHGVKGRNDGPVAANLDMSCTHPFPNAEFQKLTDGEVYFRILEGRRTMPNSRNSLRDEERWMLVHYLRALADGVPAGN